MKSKLTYLNVYKKRSVRDPIDWDAIEAKRNEGWEPVFSIGNLTDSIRNPSTAPLYIVFKKDDTAQPVSADKVPDVVEKPVVEKKRGRPPKTRFAAVAEKKIAEDE
jgi:hypothetical protein